MVTGQRFVGMRPGPATHWPCDRGSITSLNLGFPLFIMRIVLEISVAG